MENSGGGQKDRGAVGRDDTVVACRTPADTAMGQGDACGAEYVIVHLR